MRLFSYTPGAWARFVDAWNGLAWWQVAIACAILGLVSGGIEVIATALL